VLKDQNNQEVRLSSFRGHATCCWSSTRSPFTGTCQGELCSVRDNLNDFVNDNVQVLTVSVDASPAHKVWAEREGYEFPLLADFWPHGAVAQRTASSTTSGASPTGARSSSTRPGSSGSRR
jgi:peroxiredoxin (alkyl hydroperoxide reductase subunit C)